MLSQMFIYSIWGIWQIKREADKIETNAWSNQNEKLTWLRRTQLYFIASYLLLLACKLLFNNDLGDYIVGSFITVVIYIVSFAIMARSAFFDSNQARKYEKSSLTDDSRNANLIKLEQIIQIEKPHLKSNFSLSILSKKMGLSTHHLSQILNESLGQTFFEYLAAKRIEESQILLKSSENSHIKIEEIAEMVGYNSKSAFNNAFKKITGFTPSEYRQKP
jgi:AraC-like DNA-binding protein